MRRTCLLLLALTAGVAHAADEPSPLPDTPIVADPPAATVTPEAISPNCVPCDDKALATPSGAPATPPPRKEFLLRFHGGDPDAYSIVSVSRGLSTHKPMFLIPATYSPDYTSEQTEFVFQLSAKQQLFGTPLYFGYSQRSFWQVYDGGRSRPFRETDYNPELFYRWTPDSEKFDHWGADIGIEHESNGQDVPLSRSWNRVYFSPFRAKGRSLVYIKAWYRIPEDEKKTPDDPKGDDNPDIDDYLGYGEVHFQRQIGKGQAIHTMIRANPATGRGAINVNYTVPSSDGYVFYQLYIWHGYGESLLDYNDSVTRVGIGFALSR